MIGEALNVCCGMSKVGQVRLDITQHSMRTEAGDLFKAKERVGSRSFDTVICDPPYSYFSKFKWLMELSDIARKRMIVSSPQITLRIPRFSRKLYAFDIPGKIYLRLWWVFDRAIGALDEYDSGDPLKVVQ